jgi:3-oxoacyl-[acyl-carrier protein] reductase
VALLAEVERRLGLPTILVNNAAHSTRDGWRALDAATLDVHYAVNLRATALLSVGLARRLVDRPGGGSGGRIVNLSSGQARGPMPEELAYVASKGAIEALTVTLAAELGPHGITVNAVNPGPTDTGWMSDDLKAELRPRFPLGRIGQGADAARLIAFLVSDAGGWITGEIIHSTGGFR